MPMTTSFDLDRFLQAQELLMDMVRQELADGMKRTHWMWFVFPQLTSLGRSHMAQRYAITSLQEADAYLQHPVLGRRLVDCTNLINRVAGRSVHDIFGSPDDMKFRSSMTLFACAADAPPCFEEALVKFFVGAPDKATLDLLATHAGH